MPPLHTTTTTTTLPSSPLADYFPFSSSSCFPLSTPVPALQSADISTSYSVKDISIPLPCGSTLSAQYWIRRSFSSSSSSFQSSSLTRRPLSPRKSQVHSLLSSDETPSSAPSSSARRFLLLHGWLDNSASFDLLLPELFTLGIVDEAIALDMIGHGRSSHRQPYQMAEFVSDAAHVLDYMHWQTCGLISHSMGGAASAMLAATFPDRILSLVMLDILGPLSIPTEKAPANLRKAIEAKSSGSKRVFASLEEAAEFRSHKAAPDLRLPHDLALRLCMRGCKPDSLTPATSHEQRHPPGNLSLSRVSCLRQMQEEEGQGYVWSSDSRLLKPTKMYVEQATVCAFLRQIECPVLVVITTDGIYRKLFLKQAPIFGWLWWMIMYSVHVFATVFRQKHLREKTETAIALGTRYSSIKRRTLLVTGGGHHVHMTRPARIASAISSWFSSLWPHH